jgi:5'-3' exonuclease
MTQFSPRPLICDGGYAHHYAHNEPRWAHLPIATRLALFAAQLSQLTTGPKLWAWDSPIHPMHTFISPLLGMLGFHVVQLNTRRAANIIASQLEVWADAVVISSDKDLQALATPTIDFLCHVSGWEKLHPAEAISAKWDLGNPEQIFTALAWAGDDVDGVDGIPDITLNEAKHLARQANVLPTVYLDEIPSDWKKYEVYFDQLATNYLTIRPLVVHIPKITNSKPNDPAFKLELERMLVPKDLVAKLQIPYRTASSHILC